MNHREQAILTGLYSDVVAISAIPMPSGYGYGIEKARIRDAQHGAVAIDPAKWIGRNVTASESVMNARAYKSLEELGFIERINAAVKTRALRITEAGIVAAKELLAQEAPTDA